MRATKEGVTPGLCPKAAGGTHEGDLNRGVRRIEGDPPLPTGHSRTIATTAHACPLEQRKDGPDRLSGASTVDVRVPGTNPTWGQVPRKVGPVVGIVPANDFATATRLPTAANIAKSLATVFRPPSLPPSLSRGDPPPGRVPATWPHRAPRGSRAGKGRREGDGGPHCRRARTNTSR
ncbi:hypothetical protein H6P81_020950 [Aristolochia fimbriata]|uniref:Uncharacterized protein n=1 Tax=Aristolochia fimbriata TaxID=158543 RepID=A0AAV7DXM7_ARIFI|nr:hypothetical protein H6P81_020950 [Aristolochia fimbriata]